MLGLRETRRISRNNRWRAGAKVPGDIPEHGQGHLPIFQPAFQSSLPRKHWPCSAQVRNRYSSPIMATRMAGGLLLGYSPRVPARGPDSQSCISRIPAMRLPIPICGDKTCACSGTARWVDIGSTWNPEARIGNPYLNAPLPSSAYALTIAITTHATAPQARHAKARGQRPCSRRSSVSTG